MSLREDNECAARVPAGKYWEWMHGEYVLPPEPYPTDPSAREGLGNYEILRLRGE